MNIQREDQGAQVAILRLSGEMVGGPETETITDAVRLALTEGRPHILIDLAEVPWMSSGGIGILTRVHTTLKRHQGRLKLLHPSERIRKVLLVTGLLAIFETFDDEATAVASFDAAPPSETELDAF
jgi:anti-sigma B factor antagonist